MLVFFLLVLRHARLMKFDSDFVWVRLFQEFVLYSRALRKLHRKIHLNVPSRIKIKISQSLFALSIKHFNSRSSLLFLLISLGVVAEMAIKTIPWVPSFTTTRRRSARPAPSTSCFLNPSNCDQFV